MEHKPEAHLHQDPKQSCDCAGSYFYGRIPCIDQPHYFPGATSLIFGFADAVHTKTNAAGIYAIDTDGALLIKVPGTYSAAVTLSMNSMEGFTGPSIVSLALYVESFTGYTPFTQQQLPVLLEPITADHLTIGNAMFHAHAVIHVGDVNYGVGVCPMRAYFVLSADGVAFTPDIEVTVRN